MFVHGVAALSPVAAASFMLHSLNLELLSIGSNTWHFVTVFSIIALFLVSLPSTITGIFERNRGYARWHATHKKKLCLSLLLLLGLIVELFILAQFGLGTALISPMGALVIVFNNLIVFLLGAYGFKMTLGRQSLEKTSYTPDLFQEEPVDILVAAGKHRNEEAKYLDLLTER